MNNTDVLKYSAEFQPALKVLVIAMPSCNQGNGVSRSAAPMVTRTARSESRVAVGLEIPQGPILGTLEPGDSINKTMLPGKSAPSNLDTENLNV